ncbi:hypothetical protein KHA80_11870 [Anaerobacillus sp. HL2]|nr:hypothetical protein KHA80_11870 [Anaerobacillus sp. HL2]
MTLEEKKPYEDRALMQQMINMSLSPMMAGSDDQRIQLEDAIRQLRSNMSKNTYDLIEARHGIQLMMAGRYTQLLATEQVQKLNEEQLNLKKRNKRGLEIRNQIGLISKDELSRASGINKG